MRLDPDQPRLAPADLRAACRRAFELAADKCRALDQSWDVSRGAPVYTVEGRYTTRGWTEWTEGFVYGCMILAGDALNDEALIHLGRTRTIERMLAHVTHMGVHDHGFNNLSTYGQLRRLLNENRLDDDEAPGPGSASKDHVSTEGQWQRLSYENAIRVSGAVQASRWAGVRVNQPSPYSANSTSLGYVTSFNGPHSLFIDTIRSMRILSLAWRLGHVLKHEGDRTANLLKRSVLHGLTTNQYLIFHGESGHTYDIRGRTAHEAVFNPTDGAFRCRATQQGYSPFSTWTRGLAWAMLGYSEQLEFLATIDDKTFEAACGLPRQAVMDVYEQAARQTCDHYIHEASAADGVPYWDDGAPRLGELGDWRAKPADPCNQAEPVDSSAAAIAAQGLLRLGHYLRTKADAAANQANQAKTAKTAETAHAGPGGDGAHAAKYRQAGLKLAATLLDEPYLSTAPGHQGLLLHSIYHRPNGWDHIPAGCAVPCGESSLWGDYHLLELAHLIDRQSSHDNGPDPTFFS